MSEPQRNDISPADAMADGGRARHVPTVVRPGDPMVCANGHGSNGMPSVPTKVTGRAWLVRCNRCGWAAYLRPHFGDRPQDVCYVVEDIPPHVRRAHAAFLAR